VQGAGSCERGLAGGLGLGRVVLRRAPEAGNHAPREEAWPFAGLGRPPADLTVTISDEDVRRVAEAVAQLPPPQGDQSDAEAVRVVERAAHAIGVQRHKLDWAVWEHSRSAA